MAQVIPFPADFDSVAVMTGAVREKAVDIVADLIDRAYKSGFSDGYNYAQMQMETEEDE